MSVIKKKRGRKQEGKEGSSEGGKADKRAIENEPQCIAGMDGNGVALVDSSMLASPVNRK